MALLDTIRTEDQWKQFFAQLKEIPSDVGEKYAKSFVENRITEVSLKSINKQDLKDLGITVLGDIKTVLNHVQTVYTTDARNNGSMHSSANIKMSPQEVPKVKMGMTRIEFAKFRHDWSNLKALANIPQTMYTHYLYTACDKAPSVQSSILFLGMSR